MSLFLSTLSLRRATQAQSLKVAPLCISIHALLAESDIAGRITSNGTKISIHALLAESDQTAYFLLSDGMEFLSTLSLRRATLKSLMFLLSSTNFYPRSPCGERLDELCRMMGIKHFYPRSPCGERLSALAPKQNPTQHFYPRSPCGERHGQSIALRLVILFLSTLSLRRATAPNHNPCSRNNISIHALLAESDSKSAQNSGALLRIWNKFYGDCIFMLTGKAVFYPFCPCFFHIFWCEGTGNFMIAFPSH